MLATRKLEKYAQMATLLLIVSQDTVAVPADGSIMAAPQHNLAIECK